MKLEAVTIGAELLLGFTLDTNARDIGLAMSAAGVEVVRRTTIPDRPEAIRAAVQAGLAVTCRTSLFLPGRAPLASNHLPSLPDVAYVQRGADTPHASIVKLGQLIHAAALDL